MTTEFGSTVQGPESLEARIIDYVAEDFRKQNGIDLRKDVLALKRLTESVQKARIDLSTKDVTEINLPFIAANAVKPLHLKIRLTRDKLDEL